MSESQPLGPDLWGSGDCNGAQFVLLLVRGLGSGLSRSLKNLFQNKIFTYIHGTEFHGFYLGQIRKADFLLLTQTGGYLQIFVLGLENHPGTSGGREALVKGQRGGNSCSFEIKGFKLAARFSSGCHLSRHWVL